MDGFNVLKALTEVHLTMSPYAIVVSCGIGFWARWERTSPANLLACGIVLLIYGAGTFTSYQNLEFVFSLLDTAEKVKAANYLLPQNTKLLWIANAASLGIAGVGVGLVTTALTDDRKFWPGISRAELRREERLAELEHRIKVAQAEKERMLKRKANRIKLSKRQVSRPAKNRSPIK